MKQSIHLTRATLYFKFMAFRDLTSVRAGATPQRASLHDPGLLFTQGRVTAESAKN